MASAPTTTYPGDRSSLVAPAGKAAASRLERRFPSYMTRIQTLSHPTRRTWFEYEGSVGAGVVLQHKVRTQIPARLFTEAMQHFSGRTVVGGFSMTDPPLNGFGAWVAHNAKELAGRTLTPRHASFIAAILIHETYIRNSRKGNAIFLHF